MSEATAKTSNNPKENGADPVVVDLGKKRRAAVKKLCKGQGALMDDVMRSIETLKMSGQIDKSAQTVLVVVRPRRKKQRMFF